MTVRYAAVRDARGIAEVHVKGDRTRIQLEQEPTLTIEGEFVALHEDGGAANLVLEVARCAIPG